MKNTKKRLIFLLKFKWDIFGGFSYTVELFIHTTAGNRKKKLSEVELKRWEWF